MPGFRKTPWTSLVEYQPEKARAQLAAALRKAKGSVTQAAEDLGLSRFTLYRYCERVGLTLPTKKERNR